MGRLRFMFFLMVFAMGSVSVSASQPKRHVSSLNLANIILDNNRLSDVGDIMAYYGWSERSDSLTWRNGSGDEIRVTVDEDGRSLNSVELLTVGDRKVGERLANLQYSQALREQREMPRGYRSGVRDMYASGRKRVAVMSDGGRSLIVFFRSSRQAHTRFGPE